MKRIASTLVQKYGLEVFTKPEEPLQDKFLNPANDKELLRYFQDVRRKFLYTTNLGLAIDDNDSDATGKPVLLNNLFIPPLLSDRQCSPEEIISSENEPSQLSLQEVYQALRQNPRLFILGIPGSGKTTLIQWLMLALTYSGDNHVKGALGNIVPFALILRDLNLHGVQNWSDLWRVYTVRSGLTLSQQFCENLATTGQALFLIDGLDEISDASVRVGLGKALIDGMNRYNRCRFVITSRIVGFSPAAFFNLEKEDHSVADKQVFKEEQLGLLEVAGKTESKITDSLSIAYLAPFNTNQVRRFVVNWYNQYEAKTSIHAERVEDLMARIEKNDGLGRLSRIPVLLNMICFIHARRARLPDGRAELYERIAQTYLVSLDRARGLGLQKKDINIDYQDLSNWLAALALGMQVRRGTGDDTVLASKAEIESVLLQGLTEKGVSEAKRTDQCKFILDYIVNRSGFLVPVGREANQEVYAFNHLSFLEYFAARALDEKISFFTKAGEWKEIRTYLGKPHWLETFILLFEIQPSVKKADHLATTLFGKELKCLGNSAKKKNTAGKDVSYGWLIVAHIAMDTAVRLGVDIRGSLIERAWQAVLPVITTEDRNGGILSHGIEKIGSQVASILFQDQFRSLGFFTELAIGINRLSLSGKHIHDIGVLSNLAKLQYLSLDNTQVSDIGVLSGLSNLQYLSLYNTQVSDIGVLSGLSNLQHLSLYNTQVSDIGVLSSLSNLQYLVLSNTQVSDIGVLSGLSNLQILILSNTQVSDIGVLSGLSSLQYLSLSNTQVSDIGVLSGLSSLQYLFLSNTQVSDIGVLSGLANLRYLYLANTQVSDIGALYGLSNLQNLYLANTQVSDIGALSSLPNLQYLSLANTQVSDIGVLSGLSNLKRLSLNDTQVSDVKFLEEKGVIVVK